MVIILILLVFLILLLGKNIKQRKIKILILLVSFLIIVFLTWENGMKSYYYLSNGKYITVWKKTSGEVYIIHGKYKNNDLPQTNYIKTTNDNSIIIIYKGDKEYDYVIFNNYGKSMEVNIKDSKIKYYDYNEREEFYNKYYGGNFMKPQYKYFEIDIKENLTIINGVGQ